MTDVLDATAPTQGQGTPAPLAGGAGGAGSAPVGARGDAADPAPVGPGDDGGGVAPASDETHDVDRRVIALTMVGTIVTVVVANALLLWIDVDRSGTPQGEPLSGMALVPWQPVVAVALTVVSLATFGGFYVAARRARIAITASFLMTFLAMLPLALTIPELSTVAEERFVSGLLDQFASVVGTVVVFYFGSEAVITGGKLLATARSTAAAEDIRRVDRDLATTIPTRTTP